jgi:parallel beta-helix repeat protein
VKKLVFLFALLLVGVAAAAPNVVSTTESTATVQDLDCGSKYRFTIRKYEPSGSLSSTATYVYPQTKSCPDTQPPSAPQGLTATGQTQTSISVSWSASTDNVGVAGYHLYRNGVKIDSTSATGFTFGGLSCGTSYTLAVEAHDAADNRSAKSNVVVATTACPDTTPPSTPTGLSASNVSQTGLTLTWNASSDNVGVAGYDVYRNNTKMVTVTSTSSDQGGLACGTSYTFAVEAFDVAGNRSPRAPLNTSTSACSAPPPRPPAPEPSCMGIAVQPGDNLQAAINAHPHGTTFCIKAGLHRMQNYVVPKSNDRFVGEPGAVLNGSKLLSSFSRAGSYWVASGQTQQNPVVGGECRPSSYAGCKYADDVYFDNSPLWRVTTLAELGPGEFYFDYAGDQIYLADDPAGHKVEAAVATRAFKGWGSGANGVVIRGLVVEKFATEAGMGAIEAGGWTIEDNEVRLSHGAGIRGGKVVRNNHLHHNGMLGLWTEGTDILVEGNELAHNNYAGYCSCWAAGGMRIQKSARVTVVNNYAHDNKGFGLWTDWDNIHVVYENNLVEDNTDAGIFHEASFDAVIRNNTVLRNGFTELGWIAGAGILLNSSGNVEIYGNTVDRNHHGISITQTDRGSGPYGPRVAHDVYVHDNTITMLAGATGLAQGMNDTSYYTSRNNRFQNNTYYLGCNRTYFVWQNPAGGSGYADLTKEQWVAAGNDTTGRFYSAC